VARTRLRGHGGRPAGASRRAAGGPGHRGGTARGRSFVAGPDAPGGDDQIRWVFYTSGTTSQPKGVRHTDGSLLAAARALVLAHGLTPTDVGSIAFPFAHVGGPHYLGTVLEVGFPVVLIEKFVPATTFATYRDLGVTIAGGSTAFYAAVLDEQRRQPGRPVLPSLRLLSGGAAPKPPRLYFDVLAEVGCPILHGFGMTESPCITMGALTDTDRQRAYSDGAPVEGMELRILLPDGSPAATGVEGEVLLRGSCLCAGYTDPALTAAAFDGEGWFRSGDLGRLHADGHLTITGRLKDVIIRKGENVSAREIEELMLTHPKVRDVAVIGLPDPASGERVCAVVEPVDGGEAPSLAEVLDHLRAAGLPRLKMPERLEIVETLPRNALQKVLKARLRQQFATRRRTEAGPTTIATQAKEG
jgi:cyclohexanecarboxylate-CoA ligase